MLERLRDAWAVLRGRAWVEYRDEGPLPDWPTMVENINAAVGEGRWKEQTQTVGVAGWKAAAEKRTEEWFSAALDP